MPHLRNLMKNTFLFVGYTGLALWIGEVHPFTLVPMYNHFPNWAYAFYLTNENQKLLPVKKYFKHHSVNLGHLYCGIAVEQNIRYGNREETDSDLEKIGNRMIQQICPLMKTSPEGDYIQLHRKAFFLVNGKIHSQDQIIAEISTADCSAKQKE